MCLYVPAGAGGYSVGCVGHKGDLCGTHCQHKIHEFAVRVSFDVELTFENRTKTVHIVAAYVPLVGARMHGDAVGAERLAVESHRFHIGAVFAACVAKCGYFVYINT